MLKTNLIAIAAVLMLVANASLFAMDMRQDGVVTSTMMMQLRPGITKAQVLSIMGKPLTENENLANRWDYTYQKWHEGQLIEQRRVTLEFENDTLNRIQSELIPVDNTASAEQPPSFAALPADHNPDLKLEHRLQLPYVPDETMEETHPEPGTIVVEGDKMDFYLERKMRSFGNASIKKEGQAIYGDKIEYDVLNDELHVVGNTRIEFEGLKVWGPELRMHLYDTVGEMQQPSFELETRMIDIPQLTMAKTSELLDPNLHTSDQLATSTYDNIMSGSVALSGTHTSSRREQTKSRGDAKKVLFEGEHKKVLKSARYTTCEVDQHDWYIKASDLEIDTYTKRATALNARVEFMGVPLLYTPWIDFSYLNQRKSGFLSPTVGTTSRSGFEVQVPYYWNIAPEMDATLGVRALSKRGVQLQGEFRYLDESFSGVNNAEYLPSDNNTGEDRYYVNLTHRHSLGNGWSAGYNYEKVSDDEYFSELDTRITVTSRVNLAQQAFVNYSDEVWSFNGLVQKYQTLDKLSFPYERLPQLTLNGARNWELVNTSLYAQWVSFDRKKDEPFRLATSNNTLLETGVTGNRFTLYPSVTMPFEKPYGYIRPKFGVHYTTYSLDNESFVFKNNNGDILNAGIFKSGNYESDNRSLPIFSLDSGLFFDREMKVVNNRYTQTLEPRLFYLYVPYRDQSMFPIFDTAEADLNLGTLFMENQFTGNDRFNDANQLSLGFTTRMIDKNTGQQRLAATLGQRFHFSDRKVTMPGAERKTSSSSDIVAAITARLANHWNVDAGWQFDTDRSTTVKSNIGARYTPEPGKVLNLSYRYTEDRLEQINVSGQWPFGNGWYGMGRWNYSLFENQPIEGLAGIEYDAGCWQARTVLQRVSTATADANYALYFQLELGGLTSIGSNPMRLLERSIPGYSPTGEITNTYDPKNE